MDFRDSPTVAAFRQEVRDFITREAAQVPRPRHPKLLFDDEASEATRRWEKAVARKGWIAAGWPRQYGGAGLGVLEQFVLNHEFAIARLPNPGATIAVSLVGPTLIAAGTPEQKVQHLPPILSGEGIWCQGFSEPGAGSDLANLQTRALRNGDDYVIDGAKIWTSFAHEAGWMILLARTDTTAPKHRGISFFLVDMRSPGITLRRIEQMTGRSQFNEVFFDQVHVPAANMVGEEHAGWYVATTTLDYERSSITMTVGAAQEVEALAALARESGRLFQGPGMRLELASRAVEAEVALLLSHRVVSMQAAGRVPNYEASVVKLFSSELRQRIAGSGVKVAGLYAQLTRDSDLFPLSRGGAIGFNYMAAVPYTIAGGTSEIQRNVIATRGLGMPRD